MKSRENYSVLPEGMTSQLQSALQGGSGGAAHEGDNAGKGARVKICMSMPKEMKDKYKDFFDARGVSLTFGFCAAADFLIGECESGAAELSYTGARRSSGG